jgi:hypothetical protein
VVSFPQVSPSKPCMQLCSSHTCYILRPSHFLDLITRIIFVEEYRSYSSSLCSFLLFPVA